jgi:tripartite-type tricarboxylate transporter receptor subunit TctC
VPVTSPYKSVADVTAAAKKRNLTFAAGNSSSRVAAEMYKQMAGADLTYVPYRGNPQAVIDLIGGQVDLMFADTGTALTFVQSGKLRALAYTGTHRMAGLPDVPTMREAGVKDYDLSYWVGVYVPRGTPPEIVQRLNKAFVKAAKSDAVAAVYKSAVLDVYTTTPEELAAFQARETEAWGRVIKAAGIKPE